jgi:hypothetical protein
MDLRKQIPDRQKAITESINQAFPTIVTSGTILLVATFIIGILVSDPLISSLGYCLCRGVLISILSAMFVLPCLLVDCDKIFDHTEMRVKVPQVSALKNTFRKASSKALKATTKLATASAITAETTTTTTAEPTDTETTETTSEQQPSSENPIEENTDTNTEEKKEEN